MPVRPSFIVQFGHPTGQGWSERYWSRGDPTLEVVRAGANQLLDIRSRLLANKCTILNAYVSFDDVARDCLPVRIPRPQGDGRWNTEFGAINGAVDIAPTTLLLRLYGGARGTSYKYLGGIPDVDINSPPDRPQDRQTEAFTNQLALFITELKDNWGFKGYSDDPTVSPQSAISNIVDNGDGTALVTVASTTNVALPGKPIKIKEVTHLGDKRINKNWRVQIPVTATTFKLAGFDIADFLYQGGGFAQAKNFQIYNITDVRKLGATSRKRGAPAGQRRGRVRRRSR